MSESLNKEQIIKLLPHREPMLLIDELLNIKKLVSATAIVNVKKDSFFVQGHFPGQPVMPGVLILEAMAQAGGFLVLNSIDDPESKLMYFTGINKSRFKKTVIPGDQVHFEVSLDKFKMGTCSIHGIATVDGAQVAEGEILASVVDRRS